MTNPRPRAAARVAALLLAAAGALAACAEDVRREPATLAALAQAAPVGMVRTHWSLGHDEARHQGDHAGDAVCGQTLTLSSKDIGPLA
jgi:hypothetical protein